MDHEEKKILKQYTRMIHEVNNIPGNIIKHENKEFVLTGLNRLYNMELKLKNKKIDYISIINEDLYVDTYNNMIELLFDNYKNKNIVKYMFLLSNYGYSDILFNYFIHKRYYDYKEDDLKLHFMKIEFNLNQEFIFMDKLDLKVFDNIHFNDYYFTYKSKKNLSSDDILLIIRLNHNILLFNDEIKTLKENLCKYLRKLKE